MKKGFLLTLAAVIAAVFLTACNEQPPKHIHEYSSKVTEPTCLERGYNTYTCECGKSYISDYTDPLGHNYVDKVCTRCGWIEHEHNYETTVIPPTCTESGYTFGKCSTCGANYKAYFVDPLGHNFENDYCTRCNKRNYTVGLEYELSEDGTYYKCVGLGNAEDEDVVIPYAHNGKPVTAIRYKLIYSVYSTISTLKIPSSVTTVERSDLYDSMYIFPLPIVYFEAKEKPKGWDNSFAEHVVLDCKNNDVAEDGNIYTVRDGIIYKIQGETAAIDGASYRNLSVYELSIPEAIKFKNKNYSVTTIGSRWRSFSIYIEKLILPASITEIEAGTFINSKINNISVAEGNKFYHSKDNCLIETQSKTLLYSCDGVIPDDGSVTTIAKLSVICGDRESVFIPSCITNIGSFAFYNSNISGIVIYCEAKTKPDGWDEQWRGYSHVVVWDCKNNEVADNGAIYTVIDGLRYSLKDGVAAVTYQANKVGGDVEIPSLIEYKGKTYYVNEIDEHAFSLCFGLQSIAIPVSVNIIQDGAFISCPNLKLIVYGGTKQQWNDIEVGLWPYSVRPIIRCTDGEITYE